MYFEAFILQVGVYDKGDSQIVLSYTFCFGTSLTPRED